MVRRESAVSVEPASAGDGGRGVVSAEYGLLRAGPCGRPGGRALSRIHRGAAAGENSIRSDSSGFHRARWWLFEGADPAECGGDVRCAMCGGEEVRGGWRRADRNRRDELVQRTRRCAPRLRACGFVRRTFLRRCRRGEAGGGEDRTYLSAAQSGIAREGVGSRNGRRAAAGGATPSRVARFRRDGHYSVRRRACSAEAE